MENLISVKALINHVGTKSKVGAPKLRQAKIYVFSLQVDVKLAEKACAFYTCQ